MTTALLIGAGCAVTWLALAVTTAVVIGRMIRGPRNQQPDRWRVEDPQRAWPSLEQGWQRQQS